MGNIHDATPAGAEEEQIVEPTLAIIERPSNDNLVCGETDESFVPARFECRNVPDAHNPALDIVRQQHKIVEPKYRTGLGLTLFRG